MNDNQLKISLESRLDSELQELTITTYSENHLGQKVRMFHAELYELKDQALRNALIELGWTPPKDSQ